MKLHALTRHMSFTLIMVCVCLLLSTIPPGVVRAAYVVPQLLGNDVPSFVPGSFQRTQLSTIKSNVVTQLQDQEGAAQLVPVGMLQFNDTALSKPLPYRMIRMGVTTVGKRIYIIGGIASGGNPVKNNETIAEVYSADIITTPGRDQLLGDITSVGWRKETSLNAVQSSDLPAFAAPTAPVNSPAVTSVTVNGKNYIYVIGGNTSVGVDVRDFSSYAVRRATVNADGTIPAWVELPGARIPTINSEGSGLQGAAAVTMTIRGSTYIYVVGGLQRYLAGGTNLTEIGSAAVLWAKVDPANGNLLKTDGTQGWNRMSSDLPLATSTQGAGLWDAAAIADIYNINQEDLSVDKAIHVFGGQMVSDRFNSRPQPEYNSKVHQLYVDDDGSPTIGDWQNGTLPESRFGLGAVTYRGKQYLTGGITPGTGLAPRTDMLTSYMQDDLTLPNFGGDQGANFLKDENGLNAPLAFHGMAIVPVGESAFVYLIGGQSSALTTTPQYLDQVVFGKIGGQEESQTYGFAPDGWYYGKPVEFTFRDAEVEEISWGTLITDTQSTGMDVRMFYRVSLDNTCTAPSWSAADWRPIDGDTVGAGLSKIGDNTVSLQDVKARCFQYRAQLIGGAPLKQGLPTQTPSLLYVSLKVTVPGSPDLRADKPEDIVAQFNDKGQLTGLNIQIRNYNDKSDLPAPQTEPTLDVNIEKKGGSFFVDVFIYKEGESIVPPTIPVDSTSPNNVACANINKDEMPAGAVRQITRWSVASPDADCISSPTSLLNYFAERGEGRYTVFVVVDSVCGTNPNGCVDETTALNGEANNVSRYDFEIKLDPGVTGPVSYDQRLPMLLTKP